MVPGY